MRTILVAGGTGLIGTRLCALLKEKGYSVRLLTRTPRGEGEYAWDPANHKIDEQALDGVDAVINLAGAGIAEKRWTAERKKLLIDSRVQSARVLRDAFNRTNNLPGLYLAASATGFYGNSGDRLMHETDTPADQLFLSECCIAWEEATETIGALGIRTAIFRIGIVLSKKGGALAEFIKPLRFGIGAYFGDGQAWYSWIQRDDLCRMFIWALENPAAEGIYNAVAPHPVRNKDLIRSIARAFGYPALFAPVPMFVLRVMLGELVAGITNSNNVSADKIRLAGFQYKYPELEGALAACQSE
jgi:hypothetical protein